IFIAVGTPETPMGDADTSAVFSALEEIAPLAKKGAVIVLKSTVPIGTNQHVRNTLKRLQRDDVHVVSNPEFLREGSAIEDFMRPDRVIVGTLHKEAAKTMEKLYAPVIKTGAAFVATSPETAETIKYAANSFLAMKISFINQMADLCEKVGSNVLDVAHGIGLDARINPHFLRAGPGYGGSCFPKDTRALCATAQKHGVDLSLIETTIKANEHRKTQMAERIAWHLGGTLCGKTLGVLGATFKANTDDVRESPAIAIIELLTQKGATIQLFDPKISPHLEDTLQGVSVVDTIDAAALKADALIVLTEWAAFKSLDFKKLKANMRQPLMIDLRNVYRAGDVRAHGFTYYGLGQPSK
ncbi:MAG: UDP-glucose dehydrogenase family protein, partial [Holosporaceae bacterium]